MDQCYNLNIHDKTNEDLFKIEVPLCITLRDVTAIIKSLIALEVAFLQGFSLMETTHNCVLLWHQSWPYLAQDSSLESRILLAFSKSLVKTLGRIFTLVTSADIYEGLRCHTFASLLDFDFVMYMILRRRFPPFFSESYLRLRHQ